MRKRFSKEDFIVKAKGTHGDEYDYSKVDYTNSKTKVTIICEIHGEFLQAPEKHMRGQGCKFCGFYKSAEKQYMEESTFIEKCKQVHNSKYNYTTVIFKGVKKPIDVLCPEHGVFFQIAEVHMRGNGCPKCGGNFRYSVVEYSKIANKVHNNFYDYTNTKYVRSIDLISITCPIHGEFKQRASAHLLGQGCSECATYGFNKLSPAMLYYIQYDGFYKIGITNRNVELRYPELKGKLKIIQTWMFESGSEALEEERAILRKHRKLLYNKVNPITNTISREVFKRDILNLKN